jgi:hypothetical protein
MSGCELMKCTDYRDGVCHHEGECKYQTVDAFPEEFQEIRNGLLSQDNRATCDPMFLVQQQVKDYGIEQGYGEDGYIWYDLNDGEEASEEDAALCDDGALMTNNFRFEKRYYRYRWQYVTCFFTKKAADHFIKSNRYHWDGEVRTYVDSAWRNYEWQKIRAFLKGNDSHE